MCYAMVSYQKTKFIAAPLILGVGDRKISVQNNWRAGGGEGGLSNILNFGGAKVKGGPKVLGGGGSMNPNEVMVVVLKDILLCLLGFRFIYIVHIS